MSTQHFRINSQIQASQVRLLATEGTQIGVVTRDEALSKARELGVDAVEIAPLAVPPVVKLINYKKFLYQLAKKEQVAKSSQKKVDLKETRLTPFMAENDFQTKLDRTREFLEDGHKVRLVVRFTGRQMSQKQFGNTVMSKMIAAVSDISNLDQGTKWVGKQFIATISPAKKTKVNNIPIVPA